MSSQWGVDQREALSSMAKIARDNNDTITLHLLAIAEELANYVDNYGDRNHGCHCHAILFVKLVFMSARRNKDDDEQYLCLKELAHNFLPQIDQVFAEAKVQE